MPTCCMLCVPSFALLVSNKAQLKNYLDIYEAQKSPSCFCFGTLFLLMKAILEFGSTNVSSLANTTGREAATVQYLRAV